MNILKKIKKAKLNNNGSSMAIVLIGMFVVGVLGTLILASTATNFKMNVVDKNSQSIFYINEIMMDEFQASVGEEVLNVAKDAYSEVVENYVPNGYVNNPSAATAKFNEDYLLGISNFYVDSTSNSDSFDNVIQNVYKSLFGSTDTGRAEIQLYDDAGNQLNSQEKVTGNVIDHLVYIENPSDDAAIQKKYTIKFESVSTSKVVYYDASGNELNFSGITTSSDKEDYIKNNLDTITIKDVKITCKNEKGTFYSGILSDFNIIVPTVNFNLSDTKLPSDFGDLFNYALVAQGNSKSGEYASTSHTTSGTDPAVVVRTDTNVYGSLFAGSNSNNRRTSVLVSQGTTLNTAGDVLYSEGAINVQAGTLNATSLSATARIWAKDLMTSNSGTGSSAIKGSTINISNADVLLSDDLQIDGDDSTIDIKNSSLYGYGFNASALDVEYDSDSSEGLTNSFSSSEDDTVIQDHEKRSAIVVNGSGTSARFNLNTLILAGRSFVDLQDGGLYDNATYMTGESVSIKGNQDVYLADPNNSNLGPFKGNSYVSYDKVVSAAGSSSVADYLDSVLNQGSSDDPKVIYRRYHKTAGGTTGTASDMIYFYIEGNDPVEQTNYYLNQYNTTRGSICSNTLNTQELSFNFSGLKYYTVGTIINVDSSGTFGITASTGGSGISESKFIQTLNEIYTRQNDMIPSLRNDSTAIGESSEAKGTRDLATDSVFAYYVSDSVCTTTKKVTFEDNLSSVSTYSTMCSQLNSMLKSGNYYAKKGSWLTEDQVGYVLTTISSDTKLSELTKGIKGGVVIVDITNNSKLTVDMDFEGLLLVNGNVVLNGGNLYSNNDVVEYLCAEMTVTDGSGNEETLGKYILNGYSGLSTKTGSALDGDSMNYAQLVKKSNWRRSDD